MARGCTNIAFRDSKIENKISVEMGRGSLRKHTIYLVIDPFEIVSPRPAEV